jgi:hypothetical protein
MLRRMKKEQGELKMGRKKKEPFVFTGKKKFITTEEAAAMFGFAVGTLQNMRSQKRGFTYFKVGGKPLYDPDLMSAEIQSSKVLVLTSEGVSERSVDE